MAIKEILDILGENPTESVYSEGKDFVTKKIKLYIDKKKLENYVKETYNRRTKVYASKKFAYEGFMVYISSKAFINEVEEILVETDYDKREKRKGELIAEGISYIEKSDTIAQEQAKELMLIGMEAVLKYLSEQIELSLRISINNQTDNIIYQVKKELNETIQKLIQELMPKKRKVKPCPVQPQNISNELIPPIEYVGSEKVPENEKYDYGKDDEKDSLYPMLRILKEHQECRFFQLEGIGAQTCGGVGKTYTLYGVMNQVNNAGKNPVVYLLLKKVYSGFSDGSRSENQLLAEVKKQLEEDECDKALLLLDGYNELPSITCQMNFILDIASYQEQYPNSTIVVASRTKMQYADAHAFVSGDADYASLEILNELKHCYILVLERAAIEKAIGAKIETQEEYETLSTPFYISGAVAENKALIQKLAERADAGGREIDCQRHKLPTAQQIQHTHVLAGFAAAVAGAAKLAQRTGRTGATGFTVALFAVHRGAKRRYIVVVLVTLRPVGAACMVVQNHAGESGAVIRVLRVAGRQFKLQHAACGNLDAGKGHRKAVPILGKFLAAEIGIAHFGQHKIQRFVGGHGGGGCGVSIHHRHRKILLYVGQHQAAALLILDHCWAGMVKIL